jgi:poly(A) polymerase
MAKTASDLKTLLPLLKPLLASVPADTVWLVGGVLRDILLQRPLNDVDMAVKGDALKAAQKLGAALKVKPFPLDKERGTYRLVRTQGGTRLTFDFSQLRGKAIEQDLAQRDFTVNAMALPLAKLSAKEPLSGLLLDPLGGRKDLKGRHIRMVGEGALKEDPLRLLRAFRLSAELGFSLDSKTFSTVGKLHKLLAKCASERVREEMFKILASPRAADVFRGLDKTRLLAVLFPETEEMRKTAHIYYGKEGVLGHSLNAMTALDHLLKELKFYFPDFHEPLQTYLMEPVAGFPRFALMKLVELFHDVGKPATAKEENGKLHFYGHEYVGGKVAEKIGERLRLSNEENRSLGRMVRAHMRPGNLGHQPVLTDRAIFRFYRDLERDAVAMLVVSLADHFTYLSEKERKSKKDPVFLTIRRMLSNYFLKPETVQPPKIVDGHFLMNKLRLPEGPQVGRLLNAVREAQASGKVKTREQALTLAQKLLKSAKQKEPEPPSLPSRR